MKKIIYILTLITLMASCAKEQPLTTSGNNNAHGGKMYSPTTGCITTTIDCELGNASHEDIDSGDIVDPDKDDEHDKDSKKPLEDN